MLAREVSSEWVGSVSLIGGIISWLVIADGEVPFHASLAWFVALVAVAVALSLENRWFALRFLGHGLGLVAILPMAIAAEAPTEQVLIFVAAALLYASLVRVPSIGDVTSTWQQLDIQLATVAAPWAFAIISITLDFDDDTIVGSVAMIVAGVGALIALGVRRWIQPAHLGSLLIGASVSLSIGSALLLSTSVVYVALAIQGAGLVILSRSLGNSIRVLVNAAVVSLIAIASVLGEMLDAWTNDASVGDDIAHVTVIAAPGRCRMADQAPALSTTGRGRRAGARSDLAGLGAGAPAPRPSDCLGLMGRPRDRRPRDRRHPESARARDTGAGRARAHRGQAPHRGSPRGGHTVAGRSLLHRRLRRHASRLSPTTPHRHSSRPSRSAACALIEPALRWTAEVYSIPCSIA